MKVSEFLEKDDITPFLLGAFYGRFEITDNGKYIYSISTYKSSKFCDDKEFYANSKKYYLDILNKFSGKKVWTMDKIEGISRSEFTCLLENDLQLSRESFFNKLYAKVISSQFALEEGLTENKKMFIRGFMELRGSVDGTADYLAQDYFFSNEFELKRVRLLVDLLCIPVEYLNYNFRELQAQYISGENKRNTQLRVMLSWYVKNIGIINVYKAELIKNAYYGFIPKPINNDIIYFTTPDKNSQQKTTFEKRIALYSQKLLGKELNKLDIQNLRNEIGFSDEFEGKFRRNMEIVELVRLLTPDVCACCQEEYDINDRTFTSRKTNRPYFEIHHVISVGKNAELDVEDNLVKLCPVCHSQIKAGAGLEIEQKENISKMLKHEPKCFEFATHIFDTKDREKIIENIYKSLK